MGGKWVPLAPLVLFVTVHAVPHPPCSACMYESQMSLADFHLSLSIPPTAHPPIYEFLYRVYEWGCDEGIL